MIAARIAGGVLYPRNVCNGAKNVLEEINHDFDKAPTFFLVLVHGHRPITTASLIGVPGARMVARSIIAVQLVVSIFIPAPALVGMALQRTAEGELEHTPEQNDVTPFRGDTWACL